MAIASICLQRLHRAAQLPLARDARLGRVRVGAWARARAGVRAGASVRAGVKAGVGLGFIWRAARRELGVPRGELAPEIHIWSELVPERRRLVRVGVGV